MLQVLAELINHGATVKRPQAKNLDWLELDDAKLQDAFPFWAPVDIRRVQASLQNLGLLLIDPDTQASSNYFFAIDEASDEDAASTKTRPSQPGPAAIATGTASLMPPNWQPDDGWMQQCKQQGIPEPFARSLVTEFVAYWRERGQAGRAVAKGCLRVGQRHGRRVATECRCGGHPRDCWCQSKLYRGRDSRICLVLARTGDGEWCLEHEVYRAHQTAVGEIFSVVCL